MFYICIGTASAHSMAEAFIDDTFARGDGDGDGKWSEAELSNFCGKCLVTAEKQLRYEEKVLARHAQQSVPEQTPTWYLHGTYMVPTWHLHGTYMVPRAAMMYVPMSTSMPIAM